MNCGVENVVNLLNGMGLGEQESDLTEDPPNHACNYCGIHNPKAVVQCAICKRWFCNGQFQLSSSHIINHLIKAKHREVILHEKGLMTEVRLMCKTCGSSNVFSLGTICANIGENVALSCRFPCAFLEGLDEKKFEWWKPVIEDFKFVDWVVETPSLEDQEMSKQLPVQEIIDLEELWKNEKSRDRHVVSYAEAHVLSRYESAHHYQQTFSPLLKLEGDYDRSINERQLQDGTSIRWGSGLASRSAAYFKISRKVGEDVHVMPGSQLRLRYLGDQHEHWFGMGHVFKISNTYESEIGVMLDKGCTTPKHLANNFAIDCMWNPTAYIRMQKALKLFAEDSSSVSVYIYRSLLGHAVEDVVYHWNLPINLSAPNLPTLNHSQAYAVKHALKRPLSLIQGPPGTGKTVTSASIVYHLFQRKKERILVCAPSNVAVDHLAEKIHKTGLKVVRLCARSREVVASLVSYLELDSQIRGLTNNNDLKKLQDLKDKGMELSADDEAQFQFLRRSAEWALIKAADVICCTCVSAGDPRLSRLKFPLVLIDESTQAIEPECLIPLVNGVNQLILVGDQCQLGPVIMCQKASRAGLGLTLFRRLLVLNGSAILLNVQYRMHPELSRFPSSLFYNGSLKDGVTSDERTFNSGSFPWPVPNKPMVFFATSGVEEISQSGLSFLNRSEAFVVENIVSHLLRSGMKPEQIGVITPYDGQRAFLLHYLNCCGSLNKKYYQDIEIASVDAFQGREKDFIILSCVRSNKRSIVGFLKDPRRLNVALTRSRYGIIILGNVKVLSKNALWLNLLAYYQQQNVLVEGTLDCLKKCNVKFRTPPKLVNKRNPGAHFMNDVMYSASEIFIPGNSAVFQLHGLGNRNQSSNNGLNLLNFNG